MATAQVGPGQFPGVTHTHWQVLYPVTVRAAFASAIVLLTGAALSVLVTLAPGVQLRAHPRGFGRISAWTGAMSSALVVVLVVSPILLIPPQRWGSALSAYFLAVAYQMGMAPFPFSWQPAWVFLIGLLTPIVPLSGFVTLAGGLSLARTGKGSRPRILVGLSAIAVYIVAGAAASALTWYGLDL